MVRRDVFSGREEAFSRDGRAWDSKNVKGNSRKGGVLMGMILFSVKGIVNKLNGK